MAARARMPAAARKPPVSAACRSRPVRPDAALRGRFTNRSPCTGFEPVFIAHLLRTRREARRRQDLAFRSGKACAPVPGFPQPAGPIGLNGVLPPCDSWQLADGRCGRSTECRPNAHRASPMPNTLGRKSPGSCLAVSHRISPSAGDRTAGWPFLLPGAARLGFRHRICSWIVAGQAGRQALPPFFGQKEEAPCADPAGGTRRLSKPRRESGCARMSRLPQTRCENLAGIPKRRSAGSGCPPAPATMRRMRL